MKYFLFLDESGNEDQTAANPEFPIFVLCGVLTTDLNYEIIRQEINLIKEEIWNDKKIIFHSRDIRKCEKEYKVLFDLGIKKRFYDLINSAVSKLPYTIVVSSIQKNLLIEQLDKPEHGIYEIALSIVFEQVITILQKQPGKKELAIVIEQRGKKEDRQLKEHFQRLYSSGTSGFSPVDLDEVSPTFTFRNKKENIIGLQLSDLVAYPIARFLISPEKVNPAFEVLKSKIYRPAFGWGGLKVYP